MAGRGRPTKEAIEARKLIIDASPTLFPTQPYTVAKNKQFIHPENNPEACTSLTSWLQWVYQFILINKDVLSIIEIYEAGIKAPFSLLETIQAEDPDINNLLEARIINKTLKGEIKSVFASQLLSEKYGWSGETNTKTFEGDIQFKFGN